MTRRKHRHGATTLIIAAWAILVTLAAASEIITHLWPLLLIAAGLLITHRVLRRKRAAARPAQRSPRVFPRPSGDRAHAVRSVVLPPEQESDDGRPWPGDNGRDNSYQARRDWLLSDRLSGAHPLNARPRESGIRAGEDS